jgi:integrase
MLVHMRVTMPRNSKASPSLPRLFKRGRNYYFRRNVGGKDKWINTETDDLASAKKFAADFMNGEIAVRLEARRGGSVQKLADQFVGAFTGGEEVLTPIEQAQDVWIAHTPNYGDLSTTSRASYKTIFTRFLEWCGNQKPKISFVQEVDHSAAVRYSKHLRESGISGRTYNGHLKQLSRVFSTVDGVTPLPHRDPFHYRKIPRIRKGALGTIGREPLEPDMLKTVLAKSAEFGADYRDLFIVGSQTGVRLKDAALLEWSVISGDFLELTPFKTRKSDSTARMPISPVLRQLLDRRQQEAGDSEYVLPAIADQYRRNYHRVTKTCKRIFEEALGKDNTVVSADGNPHRKRNACIYSFHSFRTTLMSLLAAKDVSARDAMRMLAWQSPEMIRVYEKMLEAARGDADRRAVELVNSIEELQYDVPDVVEKEVLRPTEAGLRELVEQYSNRTIGRIFEVSDVAVRKWMGRYGIARAKRILSGDTTDEEIMTIREQLKGETK